MEPALVSLVYYCYTFLIVEGLLRRALGPLLPVTLHTYLLEFAATLSVCVEILFFVIMHTAELLVRV